MGQESGSGLFVEEASFLRAPGDEIGQGDVNLLDLRALALKPRAGPLRLEPPLFVGVLKLVGVGGQADQERPFVPPVPCHACHDACHCVPLGWMLNQEGIAVGWWSGVKQFTLVPGRPARQRGVVSVSKITAGELRSWKGGRAIAALTAYDYPGARLLDEAGIPLILVGDSVGMVVLGYPDTTHVTMEEMVHHTRAVARAHPRALLVADLPFRSCETAEQAVANARRLVDAGAEAVKAEGGRDVGDPVRAIIGSGIPFLGHLGMLPQRIHDEGRYRIKGRVEVERQALLDDAAFLATAGAFAIVLELVTPPVAAEVTRSVPIPTIGIGSGPDCDGQILVTHDLVGTFPWFTPRFVQPRLDGGAQMTRAVQAWMASLEPRAPGQMRELGKTT